MLYHIAKTQSAIKISIVFNDSAFTQFRGLFVRVRYLSRDTERELLSIQEVLSRAKIGRILYESDPVARARVDKSLANSITCLLNRAKKEIRKL